MNKFLKTTSLLLLVSLAFSFAHATARAADISVEEYCRMTRSLMELSVEEWRARVAAADKQQDGREKVSKRLEVVEKEYRARREEIYRRYGMSPKSDLHFASAHDDEIQSYLTDHPDVRDEFESLRGQIEKLIAQFESAAPAPDKGEPR